MHNGLLLLARGKTMPGIVWYTLAAGGDLEAVWNSAALGESLATGQATGGPPGEIVGSRVINYFDLEGNTLDPPGLDLKIGQRAGVYHLSWKAYPQELPAFTGVGLAAPNGLAAAWDAYRKAIELDVMIFSAKESGEGKNATALWATSLSADKIGSEEIRRRC